MVVIKLFFFLHTIGTFKFVLIPHGINCKSSKPHRLILYFSQKIKKKKKNCPLGVRAK
jgi:hypothetical protein